MEVPYASALVFGFSDDDSTATCFWDTQLSRVTVSPSGTGTPSAGMQMSSTYSAAGWDMGGVWAMDGYPVLSRFSGITPVPVALLVAGPRPVDDELATGYRCIVGYSDGSCADRTASASWSVGAPGASIDANGVLTTSAVSSEVQTVVSVQYSEGVIDLRRETAITIRPMPVGAYSGGNGTATDPYQIADRTDLLTLATSPGDYHRHFVLTADVDLAGEVFSRALIAPDLDDVALGFQGVGFTGSLDGRDHVIRNLAIDTAGARKEYLGLFGLVEGGSSMVLILFLFSSFFIFF
jgi:hypothetical protein